MFTKNFKSIVAPLKKIETQLMDYIKSQNFKITNLVKKESKIKLDMNKAQNEINKSRVVKEKIASLLGTK